MRPSREVDDRLVVHDQLGGDPAPQRLDQLEPLDVRLAQRGLVDEVPVLAQRLGPVHRHVGVAQQPGGVVVAAGQRDPDARADDDVVAGDA